MIDLHCHILPGIDDGASTMEDSLAMARVAVKAGTKAIVATPHVSWEWPDNDSAAIAAKVDELNQALLQAGLALQIRPGAEIAMTRAVDLSDDELLALRLGGGPWLLIECPFASDAIGFEAFLADLQERGHRIVLAHPERCPAFHRKPARLESCLAEGMLASLTVGSLVGHFGKSVNSFAEELMSRGHVHNVASDAHDAGARRGPMITSVLTDAGYGAQADWLARDVPLAVLSGTEIPPRPGAARGSPKLFGLLGEGRTTWS